MRQIPARAAPDTSSIANLYDRYAHIILNYISRYISSREDVDDMVLDVFIAALENQVWITWNDGEQLAWLRRVAYNKVVDYYRRTSRHPSVALEHIASTHYEDDEQMPETVALRNEDYALLRTHLSNLSELQQEIVRLYANFYLCYRYKHENVNASYQACWNWGLHPLGETGEALSLAKSRYGRYTRKKGEKHPLFSRTIISTYLHYCRTAGDPNFPLFLPFARPPHFLLQCHRTSDI